MTLRARNRIGRFSYQSERLSTIAKVSAQIVFLTLYLGLIYGRQPVELQVSPDVKSVRILVDGRESAVLKAPPWRASVDLGPAFEPRGLVAIAYDRDGDEIARTSQIINLPRPSAELTLGLQADDKGIPVSVALRWEHVFAAKPSNATISVDGKKLRVDEQYHARLPTLDREHPHVVEAELSFADGVVARRELVIAGGPAGDSISTELTPVVFTGKPSPNQGTLDGCLSVNGTAIQTRAVETPDAQLLVVRDPDVVEVLAALDPTRRRGRSWRELQSMRNRMPLDSGTKMSYTWPIATRLEAAGHIPSNVFLRSAIIPSSDAGMLGFLTLSYSEAAGQGWVSQPNAHLRFADAVAVAGLNASTGAHRRAVVLVLSKSADQSTMEPALVRRYLAAIGVPLFVWSLTGPRADLATSWGEVDDISTMKQFAAAVDRLRASLASQHVVWVASDPLNALRIEADPRCGVTPLAHLGH
jgi:hypothetical protein